MFSNILYYFFFFFFFFNDTATTEIYTLSLHDALPIFVVMIASLVQADRLFLALADDTHHEQGRRSEEHTSELQSRSDLVCRLLLEKKKKKIKYKSSQKKNNKTKN